MKGQINMMIVRPAVICVDMLYLLFFTAGDASSAPRPAQSNFPLDRGSGGTGSAGTPTCSQFVTPASVITATEQKLTQNKH